MNRIFRIEEFGRNTDINMDKLVISAINMPVINRLREIEYNREILFTYTVIEPSNGEEA